MRFRALPETSHTLVELRPIEARDLAAWYGYLSSPAVHEYMSWAVESVTELEAFIGMPEIFTASSQLRFAMALRTNGRLIGTAGFHTISTEHKTAELAYDLAPIHWGNGIATQVCRELVSWAHTDLGLIRVQATVLESNSRSAAVLQRCGFKYEGILRSYRMVRGMPGNFHMYSHVMPICEE